MSLEKTTNIKSWLTPKKIALGIFLIIATFIAWYITLPALLIWWFVKTDRVSHKAKVISGVVAGSVVLLFFGGTGIAYFTDETPSLRITEPTQDQVIKGATVVIKGEYQPSDRTVWINGEKIPAANGSFEFSYDLAMGENRLEIEAGNWKRAEQKLALTRELSDEEVAEQQHIEAEREEQEKQEQEAQLAQQEAERQAEEAQKTGEQTAEQRAREKERRRQAEEEQTKSQAEADAQKQAEESEKQKLIAERANFNDQRGNNAEAAGTAEGFITIMTNFSNLEEDQINMGLRLDASDEANSAYAAGGELDEYRNQVRSARLFIDIANAVWTFTPDSSKKDLVVSWVNGLKTLYPNAVPNVEVSNGIRTVATGSWSLWGGEAKVELK